MDQSQAYLYAIPLLLLMVAFQMWRGSRVSPLRIERMWIFPLLFFVIIALAVISLPPPLNAFSIAAFTLAMVAGAAIGWLRGMTIKITVNAETKQLSSLTPPNNLLIFVGIFLLRFGLRAFLTEHEEDWHISAAAITDGLLIFFGAMIIAMRLEMWMCARRLLASVDARRARSEARPAEAIDRHAPVA